MKNSLTIRSSFVASWREKKNSADLVRSIKLYSSRVLSFRMYKRKNLIDRACLALANKILIKNHPQALQPETNLWEFWYLQPPQSIGLDT